MSSAAVEQNPQQLLETPSHAAAALAQFQQHRHEEQITAGQIPDLSAIPCGQGEHYCSDLLNPDLLTSESTWCAGMSSRICVRGYAQHEAREAAQR